MRSVGFVAGFVFAVLSNTGSGAVIQITVAGAITRADNPALTGIQLGDAYTARFLFDTSAPDLLPADPSIGRYEGLGSSFNTPGVTELGTSLLEISLVEQSLRIDGSSSNWSFGIGFFWPAAALQNDHFPWPFPQFSSSFFGGFHHSVAAKIEGSISSFTAVVVPEPSSCALVALALLPLMRMRRMPACEQGHSIL